jgi:hypothetical protein
MPLFPNVSVTSTKQLLGINNAPGANIGTGQFANPSTRAIVVTNNGVGAGTVYVQLVTTGTASTLTTSTYTFAVPGQPNPYTYTLTPAQLSSIGTTGLDVWLISNTTAQVSVQQVPF